MKTMEKMMIDVEATKEKEMAARRITLERLLLHKSSDHNNTAFLM